MTVFIAKPPITPVTEIIVLTIYIAWRVIKIFTGIPPIVVSKYLPAFQRNVLPKGDSAAGDKGPQVFAKFCY